MRRRGDDGTTLPELTVSMLVLSVLMAATLAVVLEVNRVLTREDATESTLTSVRLALDVGSKDLRGLATNNIGGTYLGFSEATTTAVTFYVTDTTVGLVKERIYLDGSGVLWRQRTNPDAVPADGESYTYASNVGQTTTRLATAVSASTTVGSVTTPLLQYVIDGTPYSTVTATTDLADIDAVTVTMTATPLASSKARPVTLTTTVYPTNLKPS